MHGSPAGRRERRRPRGRQPELLANATPTLADCAGALIAQTFRPSTVHDFCRRHSEHFRETAHATASARGRPPARHEHVSIFQPRLDPSEARLDRPEPGTNHRDRPAPQARPARPDNVAPRVPHRHWNPRPRWSQPPAPRAASSAHITNQRGNEQQHLQPPMLDTVRRPHPRARRRSLIMNKICRPQGQRAPGQTIQYADARLMFLSHLHLTSTRSSRSRRKIEASLNKARAQEALDSLEAPIRLTPGHTSSPTVPQDFFSEDFGLRARLIRRCPQ